LYKTERNVFFLVRTSVARISSSKLRLQRILSDTPEELYQNKISMIPQKIIKEIEDILQILKAEFESNFLALVLYGSWIKEKIREDSDMEANLLVSLKLPGQPTSFYSDGFLWTEFMTSEALNAFVIIEQRKRIQANCPSRTFFLTQATLTASRLINFGIDPEDSYSQGSK
jgi:hypothetical protein